MEPELQHAPPRPVRLTAAGRRELLYPVGGVVALVATCAWAYASRPAPGAMMPLFVGFLVLGLYLTVRLLEAWHERVLLVREGRPVAAVVVSVSEPQDGRSSFVGWYEVDHKQWSIQWTDWADSAEIGDAVTALYMPSDPGRAILYRLAGCKAPPPPDAEMLNADQSAVTPRI